MMWFYFQELRDGRLNRSLELLANLTSRTVNWFDEPCKVKGDSFWLSDRKIGINDQFCLRVGFKNEIVDGDHGAAFEAWARDIKLKAIGYSPQMPYVSVTRYTPDDYLRMVVSFDPSVSGIAASADPAQQRNDWQPDARLPAQADFYAALVAWALRFAGAVERAFAGDESLSGTDYGEPILRRP
jgi:hypothetical protein